MKILVVSDVESRYIWDFFQRDKFKDIELIISCGDVKNQYLSFLVTMLNVPLIYVPGNHNIRYEYDPPEGCDSIDGKIINYKGIKILGLGGSMRYNGRAFQYTEKEMEKRIRKLKPKIWINKGFDILVTHAPAYGINDGQDLCHKGFNCFNKLIDDYSPKYLLHGHQHLNYGQIDRMATRNNTKIVNAFEYYILDYK
ncbi:MAG: metallophosphoesterase [Clostridiaceae bacterium]